jgi:undecaprenyl phosphate-alpha-L-ara4FN deformylase
VPFRGSDAYVGLRVDVDTLRGTSNGVPTLIDIFDRYGISATIFFSVGPDNMGRHFWRLVNPAFLVKMLRSKAASLYGWDILLRGTFWPGPVIGRACGHVIRLAAEKGHEIGLHAWDHHAWQVRSHKMSAAELDEHLSLGIQSLTEILGAAPTCSASAGWKCNEAVLARKEKYKMRYHSDCRGKSIFRPIIDGITTTPQVPVTLPTYDELIGRDGIDDENFNKTLLDLIRPGQLNVLTIHAEVEGIAKSTLFEAFLTDAMQRKMHFVRLGDLLPAADQIPAGRVEQGSIPGRDGRFCIQAR